MMGTVPEASSTLVWKSASLSMLITAPVARDGEAKFELNCKLRRMAMSVLEEEA